MQAAHTPRPNPLDGLMQPAHPQARPMPRYPGRPSVMNDLLMNATRPQTPPVEPLFEQAAGAGKLMAKGMTAAAMLAPVLGIPAATAEVLGGLGLVLSGGPHKQLHTEDKGPSATPRFQTVDEYGMPENAARFEPYIAGLNVYHGSPNPVAFNEFSDAAIGSGQGSASYAHGHYFAEEPQVSEIYRQMNSPTKYQWHMGEHPVEFPDYANRFSNEAAVQGKRIPGLTDALQSVEEHMQRNAKRGMTPERAIQERLQNMEQYSQYLENAGTSPASTYLWNESQRQALKQYGDLLRRGDPMGRLYHVELPDEHVANFLDWDEFMRNQPDAVKKAVMAMNFRKLLGPTMHPGLTENVAEQFINETMRAYAGETGNKTGADTYHFLSSLLAQRNPQTGEALNYGDAMRLASNLFNRQNVKGTQYWDAFSRAGKAGTRNYVVFDPKIAKILKVD